MSDLHSFFEQPPSSVKSLFCAMAYSVVALLLYSYASYQLEEECRPLFSRCFELEDKLLHEKTTTKELSEMVDNLSDPAADEYALITELGRIPEGSKKLFFQNPEDAL
jgi:hypothetical protein